MFEGVLDKGLGDEGRQPRGQCGGSVFRLNIGDTAVVPAGQLRRFHADDDSGFLALVVAPAGRVLMPDGADRGIPDWIA